MAADNDNFTDGLFVADAERNPLRIAAQAVRPDLPKRFYETAEVGESGHGFAVLLDGKSVKTPARRPLATPWRELSTALAAEWAGQGERLDPVTMPLTRLVNSCIDGVAERMDEVAADIVKYAGSDLVSYRAGEPEGLAAAQAEAWDPLLAFARDRLGAPLASTEGIVFVAQPPQVTEAVARAVRDYAGADAGAPFRLAALHAMTTLTGSCIIALAVALRELELDAAWAAAHVDEDHQMRAWGADEEALARRARRFDEMRAAARIATASPSA
ncbi:MULTISPECIES: ATP12 family chaperone protein [Methylosinus]|uniref:ATPase n=1 Tax=Methylosinus trichosporium (strain ATCC 35070 / NCIMB 11131 / UNIQEM 75 / OB3b) TaxID=595536 RepID=A0A2D2CXD1_METT3|nr:MULTISPECIES: ATP12 family protein [Methylosinus]ATQ67385.1 ATPase [Methylosinus trichosporium OB3b]OBS51602.1 ATPase [Methylosinus sp. 3S-1]